MAETKKGHVDARLTDVSIQYKNGAFVGQYLFPEIPVVKGADEYTIYNKLNLFQTPDDLLGKYSEANEVKMSSSTATYSVKSRGLKGYVSQEDVDNYDKPLDAEIDETEVLTSTILLNREARARALAISGQTSAVGTKWNAATPGDPVSDIETAIALMFQRPNVMIISEPVWNVLKYSPSIIGKIGGGFTGIQKASLTMIAELFELDNVYVAKARYSTTKAPATASLSYVWQKDCVLAYVAPSLSRKVATFGCTFAQKMGINGNAGASGPTFRVRKWRDESKGSGGVTSIQVEHRSIEKIIASEFGYALTACIS